MKLITIKQSDGEVRGIGGIKDRVYLKEVYENLHLYRKLDAWGIDAEVYRETLLKETDMIVVYDNQHEIFYEIPTSDVVRKGTHLHFKPHRAQIFVPRSEWTVHK